MKKNVPLYKQLAKEVLRSKPVVEEISEMSVLQEISLMPAVGEVISIRSAKAHLSGLLDLVERGRDIIITSNGKPKARLISLAGHTQRKPFQGTAKHLASMPPWRGGLTAEELIREDRDSRGW